METYIIVLLLAIVVALSIGGFYLIKRKNHEKAESNSLMPQQNTQIAASNPEVLTIKFENLPALTETEEAALVEIKDSKLLARIDNVIPGAAQVVANAGAVNSYQQAVQNAGQLYQAIIPQGAELTKSKVMENAVRGFYHGTDGIQGHANLVAVDGNMGNGLAAMNVANAAMGAAAMVVGQYYMTQINEQLGEIHGELDKISAFLDKEYQSKIYALVAEIQKCSRFQFEIVENDELRMRELDHLKNLEHECAQLLGQANLTLKEFEKKKNLKKYDSYERLVNEAQTWYQYQQVLLDVMMNIDQLTYALNLGKVSKENCYSMFLPYEKQADEALKSLEAWHKENGSAFQIDVDARRRRRQGIEGYLMNILAPFNDDSDDLHYRPVSQSTISMILKQSNGQHQTTSSEGPDLFKEDVRLVAKDGKLYYLPESKTSGSKIH